MYVPKCQIRECSNVCSVVKYYIYAILNQVKSSQVQLYFINPQKENFNMIAHTINKTNIKQNTIRNKLQIKLQINNNSAPSMHGVMMFDSLWNEGGKISARDSSG